MKDDAAEVTRLLGVLKTLMRMLGYTNREVERRLDLHPSSLTRVFNGQIEAKLVLILGIIRVVGLSYGEFFDFAYPSSDEVESESAGRIRGLLEGLKPAKSRLLTKSSEPALEMLLQQILKRPPPVPDGEKD